MLSSKKIKELFESINTELHHAGETAEIGIVGGAVMCLVFNARQSTKDIDAIFHPVARLRRIIKKIADEEGLSPDWLNDAAKDYLTDGFRRDTVFSFSNLKIWAPEPRYMLAMKCLSARWDSSDRDDVLFLLKHLKIRKSAEVLALIEGYYPKNRIPPKTQFFLEEILGIEVC